MVVEALIVERLQGPVSLDRGEQLQPVPSGASGPVRPVPQALRVPLASGLQDRLAAWGLTGLPSASGRALRGPSDLKDPLAQGQ